MGEEGVMCSKREGRENILSQNRRPSRGFENEGQMYDLLSSRQIILFYFLTFFIVVKCVT